ncbi:MAG: sugar ABC transporter ATP-binding protein [Oscillospiraceae bacterium]|nr:sugar ABC transporter ATP-binding protein [Oscillospiraceae bacterium]
MEKIYKSFGSNNVLTEVNFRLDAGEICALLGENGAGKSTLMNILGGVLSADSGQIILDGKPVSFASPVESLDAGIGFIHQELNLINDLTIYENMFITHLPQKGMFLDARYMQKKTAELFERMNIDLDPCAMVRDLDASYKQIIEIGRALLQDASIIIMDEPTTSLTEPEIQRVFAMMRTLKEQGVGIIFISHKLGEVMEICDRYTVLRDGNMVASGMVSETDTRQLAAHMVGREVNTDTLVRDVKLGEEVLCLENLSDGKYFHDINLTVRAGEVLGITGLLGDGRSELFQTVFGAMGKKYSGQIRLLGKDIKISSTHQALEAGIAYLPRNRKENAIIKDMSILDNGSIVHLPKLLKNKLFIDFDKQEKLFARQVEELRIKMGSRYDLITSLSGGNQQKVVLAKWLMSDPKLLILDNPTQGVDVGAKEEIYNIIQRLAEQGVAIIVLSSEAQEVIRVCDRTLVLFHGRHAGELKGEEMTEHSIMYLATGGNQIESVRN